MSERTAWKAWITGCALAWPVACTSPEKAVPEPQPQRAAAPWDAPPLERAITIRDGRTGRRVSFDALLNELSGVDAVFLGETHIDETTHRVQLAIYDALLRRRDGRVVLALEMFERDAQPALDAYLEGSTDEAAFLEAARPWRNYRTAYRPLIERARRAGTPVVASNFPRPLRGRVAREGAAALEDAPPGQAPAELLANTPAYWKRVDNAVRGHLDMMGPRTDDQRLVSTQSLWDNAMGEACVLALQEHPEHLVLHVNGGFHSAYWDGTARQFRLRAPESAMRTVAIVPTTTPSVADVPGVPLADYVVFAEERARDVNEGKHAVAIPSLLEYRLHLPEGGGEGLPLLIWLSGDGLTAEDGLALWKERLGDEAAIAALEPRFPQTEADLSEGGRWYRAESFSEDLGSMSVAIERVWGFLLRHYGLDPGRVCLAGEGTGATVVAYTTLQTDRVSTSAVAIEPRAYVKLKDVPLPLAEYRTDAERPERSLAVLTSKESADWWRPELDAYGEVGLAPTLTAATDDPWRVEHQREDALRRALGLSSAPPRPAERRLYVAGTGDSPRAEHWARLEALYRSASEEAAVAVLGDRSSEEGSVLLPFAVRPRDFESGEALPRCPGPFGGTTILWLPPGTSDDVREGWQAIQEKDPLNAKSRFHRLRVAAADEPGGLKQVVLDLEKAGRKNLLVIPAVFYADAPTMHALRRELRDVADELTLHWRPGLGGLR